MDISHAGKVKYLIELITLNELHILKFSEKIKYSGIERW
jgi:hypothetical protein